LAGVQLHHGDLKGINSANVRAEAAFAGIPAPLSGDACGKLS